MSSGAGTRILTASHDAIAKIWDSLMGQSEYTQTLSANGQYGLPKAMMSVAFSGDESRILTASKDRAKIWASSIGERTQIFTGVHACSQLDGLHFASLCFCDQSMHSICA